MTGADLRAEGLGAAQVGLGGRVLAPVGMQHCPVDEGLHLFEGGPRPAQYRDGGPVLLECLGRPSQPLQEEGPLHAEAGAVEAPQVGSGAVGFPQRLRRPPLEEQGAGELYPCQRLGRGRLRPVGDAHGPAEVLPGGGQLVQLSRRLTQRPLGDRHGDRVVQSLALGPGRLRHRPSLEG